MPLLGNKYRTHVITPFLVPFLLSVIGILFIYSAGYTALETQVSNQYIKQIIWLAVATIVYFVVLSVDYRKFVNMAPYIYGITVFLLLVTLVFGKRIRGIKGWLGIAGLGIQPSEFAKVSLVLMFPYLFSREDVNPSDFKTFVLGAVVVGVPALLTAIQPDLGTVLVYGVFFLSIMFVAGTSLKLMASIIYTGLMFGISTFLVVYVSFMKHKGIEVSDFLKFITNVKFLTAVVLSLGGYGLFFLFMGMIYKRKWFKVIAVVSILTSVGIGGGTFFSSKLKTYQKKRLMVFLNPELDRYGAGYNIIQSKIALGSGGFTGKGFLKGSQNRLGFLPEKSTDFIFSIIGEEWGFLGTSAVIIGYILIISRIYLSARNSRDDEGFYIAVGVASIFITHIFINIGMATGTTPATGIPLPFISYGGSSLLTFFVLVALVENVYHHRFMHQEW